MPQPILSMMVLDDDQELITEGFPAMNRDQFVAFIVAADVANASTAGELYDHIENGCELHAFPGVLGHGIESITAGEVDFSASSGFYMDYANTGDTYQDTIVEIDLFGNGDRVYYCGSYGDALQFLEFWSIDADMG